MSGLIHSRPICIPMDFPPLPPPSAIRIRPCDLFQFRITLWNYESFRQLVGLLGQGISLTLGSYLHRRAQHRQTNTNIHAVSGTRTQDLSVKAMKAYVLRQRGQWDRLPWTFVMAITHPPHNSDRREQSETCKLWEATELARFLQNGYVLPQLWTQ
jgi:hypothetical protein